VLIEVFHPVILQARPDELPLKYQGTPISYLSRNDFLNLALQLRTVPELLDYLDKRRVLPDADLRSIGVEDSLYAFYVLNEGSFDGCLSIADARITVAAKESRLKQLSQRKADSDHYSTLLERLANSMATRNPHYAKDIPSEVADLFDPLDNRKNYLELQLALANLRLRERAVLGLQFHRGLEKLRVGPENFVYSAAHLDSQPDWVYVFAFSKDVPRSEVLSRMWKLLRAALAHYQKSRCLVIADRSGESCEFMLSNGDSNPTVTTSPWVSGFRQALVEHRNATFIPEN
jgi:hypothetical protein